MTPPETLFTAGETHGRALRPENELLAHSQDVGWRSLHAAIFKEAPLHVTESVRDGLYIDTVAQMMAVHLARAHSVQSRPASLPPTPTVSHQRMRQLIEFIEANLDQPLTLDAMAAQVGISALYLARAFKAAIGQSPHQYVLMRRI